MGFMYRRSRKEDDLQESCKSGKAKRKSLSAYLKANSESAVQGGRSKGTRSRGKSSRSRDSRNGQTKRSKASSNAGNGQRATTMRHNDKDKSEAATRQLGGANVYVLAEEVDRSNEREMKDAIASVTRSIEKMGGKRTNSLDRFVTHVLWAMPAINLDKSSQDADPFERAPRERRQRVGWYLRETLLLCRELNVPVVGNSWLARVSALKQHEHWSSIDPKPYEPPFVSLALNEGEIGNQSPGTASTASAESKPPQYRLGAGGGGGCLGMTCALPGVCKVIMIPMW